MARPGDEGRVGDWLESLQRDVDALKARGTSMSLGRWALTEAADGSLIATNTVTGAVTTLGSA